MRVSVVCSDPTVTIESNNDLFALDLVAHFLGMATYHNDNISPAAKETLLAPRQNYVMAAMPHSS